MENAKTQQIYSAINGIMKDISFIGKDRKNLQQGFMFRGIDQVMNTLKPLLAKHGVFVVPEVIAHERQERTTAKGGTLIYSIMTIRHHFTATDGSEVVTTTIGEGMDSADKSSNKAMAIAFKYACFQLFCIPTEEMAKDDPDASSPDNVVTQEVAHVIAMVGNCKSVDDLTTIRDTYPDMMPAIRDIMVARYKQIVEGGAA